MSRVLDNNKKKIWKSGQGCPDCRGQRGEALVLAAHIRKPSAAAALSHPTWVYAAFCCGILVAARNRYRWTLNPRRRCAWWNVGGETRTWCSHWSSLTPVVQIHHLFYLKICCFTPLLENKTIFSESGAFARLQRAQTYTGDQGELQVRRNIHACAQSGERPQGKLCVTPVGRRGELILCHFRPSWLLGPCLCSSALIWLHRLLGLRLHNKTLATWSSPSSRDCRVGNLFVQTSSAKSSSLEL